MEHFIERQNVAHYKELLKTETKPTYTLTLTTNALLFLVVLATALPQIGFAQSKSSCRDVEAQSRKIKI